VSLERRVVPRPCRAGVRCSTAKLGSPSMDSQKAPVPQGRAAPACAANVAQCLFCDIKTRRAVRRPCSVFVRFLLVENFLKKV